MSRPVEILWCGNARAGRSNGWSFPPAVERHLRQLTAGKRVLQQFGGLARWGVKLDVDRTTCPHVIGDAWLPPFQRDAFDFTRGPAIKYNRWLIQPERLPFESDGVRL